MPRCSSPLLSSPPPFPSLQEYFNELNHDSVRRVESQLDEVKEVMVKNISKVLDRGDRIELMVDKTDELSRHSYKFQNNVRACGRATLRAPPASSSSDQSIPFRFPFPLHCASFTF
jgi:hypothetical protein